MEAPALHDELVSPVHLEAKLGPLRAYVAARLDPSKTAIELDELALDGAKPYPDGDHYVWFTHRQAGYPIAIHVQHYRRFADYNQVRLLRLVCRHPDGGVYVVHADPRGRVIGAVLAKVEPAVAARIPQAPAGDQAP